MAIRTNVQKNNLATAYGAAGTFLSLHSADPGTTGGSEISGGTPAYARKAVTWSAPNNGVITGTVTFDVPANATVAFFGVFSALTTGTYLDAGSLTSQTFQTKGQYTLTVTYTQS